MPTNVVEEEPLNLLIVEGHPLFLWLLPQWLMKRWRRPWIFIGKLRASLMALLSMGRGHSSEEGGLLSPGRWNEGR